MKNRKIFLSALFFLLMSNYLYSQDEIHHSKPKTCIGGSLCGHGSFSIDLKDKYDISTIQVFAHDNVGKHAAAVLLVYVDGDFIGRQDVKKSGSWLTFGGSTTGRRISFSSEHKDGNSGGDETMVMEVIIYGTPVD